MTTMPLTVASRAKDPEDAPRRADGWLTARLYVRPELHDAVLAERFPCVLETLPDGVRRWSFQRGDHPGPHLLFSFGGAEDQLWTRLRGNLRRWATQLITERRALGWAVGARAPSAGDPRLDAYADRVGEADSEAVLAQVRLFHAGAFTILPDVLLAAGLASVAQAFRGEPAMGVTGPVPALLEPWWACRAEAVAEYRAGLERYAADPAEVAAVLDGLLRAHLSRTMSTVAKGTPT